MKKLFENLWNWFTTPNTDDCCDVEVCQEPTPVEVEEEQESVREILERVLLEAGISESTIRNLDVLSAFEQWYEGALTKEDIKDRRGARWYPPEVPRVYVGAAKTPHKDSLGL